MTWPTLLSQLTPPWTQTTAATPGPSGAQAPGQRPSRSRDWPWALLIFLLLLAVFHGIYGRFFPTSQGTLGHDCGLAFAGMVDGYIWFAKNGLWEVPWFSPSFCGGQPFFADPQSGYYSVLQWLTFITDPLTASYGTLLLFASLGFFGTYLLARRCFALALPWAILAATLYFFNGFLPHRMLIGHMGYHGLTLAPWMALALLTPVASRVSTIGFGLLAGLIAAYWLQSGLTTLMIPAALSVALILLVHRLRQPWPRDLFPRMFLAVLVSIVLSASKLVASLSFYSHFERTQYLLPGFDNPLSLLLTNLLALFGPSQMAAKAGELGLVNQQWALMPHEWAFGFSLVPLFVLIRARVLLRRRTSAGTHDEEAPTTTATRSQAEKFTKIAVILAILAICLLPLAIQFYTPALNAWYKQHPLIGATVAPMRWLIIYLPVIPIFTSLLGSRLLTCLGQESRANRLVFSFVLMIVVLSFAEPRDYYLEQGYHPDAMLAAYGRLTAGEVQNHQIRAIGTRLGGEETAEFAGPSVEGKAAKLKPTVLTGNEIMLAGVSQARCYNPSFGYRLEHLPDVKLALGDVLTNQGGNLNIRNPACFVFPEENGCQPGDRFRAEQRDAAEAFVAYRPFLFHKSPAQQLASGITITGLVFSAFFLCILWPWYLWRKAGAAK